MRSFVAVNNRKLNDFLWLVSGGRRNEKESWFTKTGLTVIQPIDLLVCYVHRVRNWTIIFEVFTVVFGNCSADIF